ncbi:MAG: hypothetical protein K0S09_1229 [Sphingobacteriaceae bacterium]|jgi:uncharacterized protein (TIGR02453 family)|nr:hypothetical protein [Sphingobacteriaceae bacterium]
MISDKALTFLKGVAENNNREWFQSHKADHDAAKAEVLDFTSAIIDGLAKIDATIPADLQAKNCLMRIYRDIRFSKDKTPYKTNFGIAISSTGKNFNGPGYYLHIEPEKSFVAGGHWMPDPNHLKAIRQEIDYNGEDFRNIIEEKSFVKSFGILSQDDKLKTVPKGYSSDHPDIEFLKLKSFTASSAIKDKDLLSPGAAKYIVEMFGSLSPFMVFLRNAIA